MSDKKLLYQRKLIKQLYFAKVLSCAELSTHIKKSIPLTTKVINDLIATGYVMETGQAPSTGGRRPAMYTLTANMFYIVSVAMDQFVTRIAIVDAQNNIVGDIEKLELPLHKNEKALSILAEKIKDVIIRSALPKDKIAGIGIGMPGFIDVKKGINYTFLPAQGKSITEYISASTGHPVYIDNDSSLIALAELRFGGAKKSSNAMVVNIGWGVGLGIIVNGGLFRGHNGFAGEFSHIPLFSNGKLCSCGKTGCLETETSLLTIIDKAKAGLAAGRISLLQAVGLEHYEQASTSLIEAAREGDRFAVELFSEAGYNIGRGVAILIHLMNPELVILSGRGSAAGRIWLPSIQQAINEHSIPRIAADTRVEISRLGYQAELIGAAALVMENYEREIPEKNMQSEALASMDA